MGKNAGFTPYELLSSKRFVHATGLPFEFRRQAFDFVWVMMFDGSYVDVIIFSRSFSILGT